MSALAGWRDVALILLSLEAFLVALAIGAALYFGIHGLRRLRVRLWPILLQARLYTWKLCTAIERVAGVVLTPFVWMRSAASGLRRALSILAWR